MSTRPLITPARGRALPLPAGNSALAQPPTRYIARRARASDADAVHALIARYAAQGLLLPRSEDDVRTNIDHFLVLAREGRVVGCVALEPYGADLAEIRSLAVASEHAGGGRGAGLARFALAIAKRRRIARVFAVTHAPGFFERLGFMRTARQSVTEKVERDCVRCPKRLGCTLSAVVFDVWPRRTPSLPIVAATSSVSAA
jgi:N-acetylglutamate synthase-like GNAT family acetyltransferase